MSNTDVVSGPNATQRHKQLTQKLLGAVLRHNTLYETGNHGPQGGEMVGQHDGAAVLD